MLLREEVLLFNVSYSSFILLKCECIYNGEYTVGSGMYAILTNDEITKQMKSKGMIIIIKIINGTS